MNGCDPVKFCHIKVSVVSKEERVPLVKRNMPKRYSTTFNSDWTNMSKVMSNSGIFGIRLRKQLTQKWGAPYLSVAIFYTFHRGYLNEHTYTHRQSGQSYIKKVTEATMPTGFSCASLIDQ